MPWSVDVNCSSNVLPMNSMLLISVTEEASFAMLGSLVATAGRLSGTSSSGTVARVGSGCGDREGKREQPNDPMTKRMGIRIFDPTDFFMTFSPAKI